MDLSFPRFMRDVELATLPGDLAVLMVGIAARQAASHTAGVHTGFAGPLFSPGLLAPRDGAFNGPMAAALIRWKHE